MYTVEAPLIAILMQGNGNGINATNRIDYIKGIPESINDAQQITEYEIDPTNIQRG